MKRIISILMCLALLLSLIPVGMIGASAAVWNVTFDFCCTLNISGVEQSRYVTQTDSSGYVSTRPDYLDGYGFPSYNDDGLMFWGWYTDPGCSANDVFDFTKPVTKAVTLYARWVDEDDMITVHVYGHGVDVPDGSYSNPTGDCYLIDDPGMEGKIFYAWYTDPDFTERFDRSQPLYEETSIYARYIDSEEDIISVSRYPDPDVPGRYISDEVIKGDWYDAPEAFDKAGYVFFGWYTDKNFKNRFESGYVYQNTSLYPRYLSEDQVVTVRRCFDMDEGLFYEDQIIKGDTYIPPVLPDRDGMVFVGWYTDRALTKPYDVTAPLTANTDLYPKFISQAEVEYISVSIYLDPDAPEMTAGYEIPKGQAVQAPATPGKTGATFGGWFLDRKHEKRFVAGTAYDHDIQLFPKFTWPIPSITSFDNVSGGLKVKWTNVGDDEYYTLFRKGPKDKNWVKIKVATDKNSYIDNTAVSGTTYTYTVRCVTYWGKTYQSGFNATGWKYTYYTMPEINKLAPAVTGLSMSWDKSNGVYGYKVFRKNGSSWKTIAVTTATSYVDKSVVSGSEYTYTVRAVNKSGSFITSYDSVGMTAAFVAAPKVSKIENTTTGAKLTWAKCNGAKKYRIFVKSGSAWKKLADTPSTSYVHTAAASGKTYTYTIRALDISGSYCSAFVSAGWSNKFIATPAAPTLKNTRFGVQITSTMPAGAVKYCVFRKDYGSNSWKRIITNVSASAKNLLDVTAQNGKKYVYTVRCLSQDGKSFVSGYNATGRTITCKK